MDKKKVLKWYGIALLGAMVVGGIIDYFGLENNIIVTTILEPLLMIIMFPVAIILLFGIFGIMSSSNRQKRCYDCGEYVPVRSRSCNYCGRRFI